MRKPSRIRQYSQDIITSQILIILQYLFSRHTTRQLWFNEMIKQIDSLLFKSKDWFSINNYIQLFTQNMGCSFNLLNF